MTQAHLLSPVALVVLFAITYTASFAKGVTTMGLNLLSVPLIATVFGVQTAVVSMLLPKILSDAFMAFEARGDRSSSLVRSIIPFACSGAVAVGAATLLLAKIADRMLSIILGASVIVFVGLQMLPKAIVIPKHRRSEWGIIFGALTGLSQGLTGVGGLTTAMYLYSLELAPTAFVFLSSVIYLALDACQVSAFLYFGLYNRERLLISVALAIPVMIGTWSGVKMRRRLSVKWFRYALLIMLFATASTLIAKAV